MTSPSFARRTTATVPGHASAAPTRHWYRHVPAPTWLTLALVALGHTLDLRIEKMRVVNGAVAEFFRLDLAHLVAGAGLLVALVWILLRRRGQAPERRAPLWALAVGAVGAAVGVHLLLTAHTGLADITSVLAGR